jgi:hypothetical protein
MKIQKPYEVYHGRKVAGARGLGNMFSVSHWKLYNADRLVIN